MSDANGPGANFSSIVESDNDSIYTIRSKAEGPVGKLNMTAEQVINSPSGDIFAYSQNAGMGWNPSELGRREFLIVSTQGGIRAPDGSPVALGYHTGHWEVGLLMEGAAHEIKRGGGFLLPLFVRTHATAAHRVLPGCLIRCRTVMTRLRCCAG